MPGPLPTPSDSQPQADPQNTVLYGTGCNAWGQLQFGNGPRELGDFSRFTKLVAGAKIERPVSRLAYTIVEVDEKYHIAGYFPDPAMAPRAATVALRANGDSLTAFKDSPWVDASKTVEGRTKTESYYLGRQVRQVVAFDTGFAVLDEMGNVTTMGDARFPNLLGRVVTKDSPAAKLAPVENLSEPVQSITACGHAVAAVTDSGAVYIWGQQPPSRSKHEHFMPQIWPEPNLAEIGDDADIQDFALGESHAIALTRQGHVYVIGSNENGQLGLPSIKAVRQWRKVIMCPPGASIVGVAAGPHTSFALVRLQVSTSQQQLAPVFLPGQTPRQLLSPVSSPSQTPQQPSTPMDLTDSDSDIGSR